MGEWPGGSSILMRGGEYVFGGGQIDRVAERRGDAAWIEARRGDPDARFLALSDLRPLSTTTDPVHLAWLRLSDLPDVEEVHETTFLGLEDGVARFAVAVSPEQAAAIETAEGQCFAGTRALAANLTPGEAGTAAQARSLLAWHSSHRFCANCGHPTEVAEAGWSRDCSECGSRHFPRTDPVVIMVVHHEDHCLLARAVRSPRYPPGLYSCLAGYVEPAETIENAVRRETLEEAGIRINSVRYHASQPWPFPSTLMIGCFATALDTEIRIDPTELESARWFGRAELGEAVERWDKPGATRMPPPFTIAHQLVRAWLAKGDS